MSVEETEAVARAAHDAHAALSWRDVYKAVGDTEERIIAAIKESLAPLRIASEDHELRIRRLELEGSTEAKEAHRAANAIGVKLDALTLLVNANTDARKGMLDTLSGGQKIVLFFFAVAGGVALLLDVFSKYFGGT